MADAELRAVVRYLRHIAAPGSVGALPDSQLLHRFVQTRDEAAFEVLVWRHGGLVLGVCRNLLHNEQDAEDAFQATFFTLARRPPAVALDASLAGWLHKVSCRIALRILAQSRQRRTRELHNVDSATLAGNSEQGAGATIEQRELWGLVIEELHRLPDSYRRPIISYFLEGKTHEQVAREHLRPVGSISRLLGRGCEMLSARLRQRGVVLPASVLAVTIAGSARATPAPTVVMTAVTAAIQFSAGMKVSGRAAGFANWALTSMLLKKVEVCTGFLLAFCVVVAGSAGLARQIQQLPGRDQNAVENQEHPVPTAETLQRRFDLYGDALPNGALARLGTTRMRQGNYIDSLAFGPDGKMIISHSGMVRQPGNFSVWEVGTGKKVRQFADESLLGSHAIPVSSDGRLLATLEGGNGNPNLDLWDVSTGKLACRIAGVQQRQTVCFAPNDKTVAVAGYKDIRLWEVATGNLSRTLPAPGGQVRSMTFTNDSTRLITGSADKIIRIWDVDTGRELRQWNAQSTVPIKLQISHDGIHLASLGQIEFSDAPGDRIHLWDIETGQPSGQLVHAGKHLRTFVFSPDGKELVAGDREGFLSFWDPITCTRMRQMPGFHSDLVAIAYAPNGSTLAIGGGGGTVRLLNPMTGAEQPKGGGHTAIAHAVLITSDGRTTFTAAWDGTIRTWDTRSGREVACSPGHSDWIQLLPLTDGRVLICAGVDKKLQVQELATGKTLGMLPDYQSYSDVKLSPDGKSVAYGTEDNSVTLVRLETAKETQRFKGLASRVNGLAFGSDGRTLLAWDNDRIVCEWSLDSGRELQRFSLLTREGDQASEGGLTYICAISRDSRFIAYGSQHKFIAIVDLTEQKEVRRFENLPDGVSAIALSPDGKTVAWGGWEDSTIRLGEIATGLERQHFTGHQGRVYQLAFSADGKLLVSSTDDTAPLVWDLMGHGDGKQDNPRPLTVDELSLCWSDLAKADAGLAHSAMRKLSASPAQTVSFLESRLRAIPVTDVEHRAQSLVAALDSNTFSEREKATRALAELGSAAEPVLRKALAAQPSLEVRHRVNELLAILEKRLTGGLLRQWRAVELLEEIGTPTARQLLQTLSSGAPDAWLTREAKASVKRLAKLSRS